MTLVYRSTVGRRLTVSEGDLNIYQLSQSDGVTFVQSGTGALTETIQAALRRLVFLSQYSTSGNYDTAKNALSQSEKMAIGGETEFISHVASVVKTVWSVPNLNTTYGDFGLCVTSGAVGAFNSNTNWQLGYNVPGAEYVSGMPSFYFSFESSFDFGTVGVPLGAGVEWHLVVVSPAGTSYRPLSIRVEDDDQYTDFSINVSKISFFDQTGVNQGMIWLPTTTTAELFIGSGTTLKKNGNNEAWLTQYNAAGNFPVEIARVNASDQVQLAPGGAQVISKNNRTTLGASYMAAATAPSFFFQQTNGAANNKNWDIAIASEQFIARVLNDADNAATNWLTVDRTANTIDGITLGGPVGVGAQGWSATTYLIAPAGTTGISSIRIPHGSAPSSPVNGDIWTTTAGLYVRVNGATVGPLS